MITEEALIMKHLFSKLPQLSKKSLLKIILHLTQELYIRDSEEVSKAGSQIEWIERVLDKALE